MTRILLLGHAYPLTGPGQPAAADPLLAALAAYPAVWVDVVTSATTRDRYETERYSERITLYRVPAASGPRGRFSQPDLLRYAWRSLRLCQLLLDRRRYDVSFAWPDWPAGGVSCLLKRQHGLPYLALLPAAELAAEAARRQRRLWLDPLRRTIWREAAALTTLGPLDERRWPARPVTSLMERAAPPPTQAAGAETGPLSWPAIARRCLQLCQQAAPPRRRPQGASQLSEDL